MPHSTISIALLVAFLTLSACASTSLSDSWKNSQYAGGSIGKVLVVGISTQASVRRIFEDTFAQELGAAGVEAIASYTLIVEDGQIPQDRLEAAVEQSGVQGVLITRMLEKQIEYSEVPSPMPPPVAVNPRLRYYYGYYPYAWVGYYEPVSVRRFTTVVAETALYSRDVPQPVWLGITRSPEPNDVRKATEEFARVVIGALKKEGLI
jgi:hypothetical protein